jgi:hypothetical protein
MEVILSNEQVSRPDAGFITYENQRDLRLYIAAGRYIEQKSPPTLKLRRAKVGPNGLPRIMSFIIGFQTVYIDLFKPGMLVWKIKL